MKKAKKAVFLFFSLLHIFFLFSCASNTVKTEYYNHNLTTQISFDCHAADWQIHIKGNRIDKPVFAESYNNYLYIIAESNSSDSLYSTSLNGKNLAVIKLSKNGNIIDSAVFGASEENEFAKALFYDDSLYIIATSSHNYGTAVVYRVSTQDLEVSQYILGEPYLYEKALDIFEWKGTIYCVHEIIDKNASTNNLAVTKFNKFLKKLSYERIVITGDFDYCRHLSANDKLYLISGLRVVKRQMVIVDITQDNNYTHTEISLPAGEFKLLDGKLHNNKLNLLVSLPPFYRMAYVVLDKDYKQLYEIKTALLSAEYGVITKQQNIIYGLGNHNAYVYLDSGGKKHYLDISGKMLKNLRLGESLSVISYYKNNVIVYKAEQNNVSKIFEFYFGGNEPLVATIDTALYLVSATPNADIAVTKVIL